MIAIEMSTIAVVVFSRNYAYSSWCVSVLAKMVKCIEKKKLIVASIPGWVLNYGLRIPFQKMLLIVALISS